MKKPKCDKCSGTGMIYTEKWSGKTEISTYEPCTCKKKAPKQE